MYAKSKLIDFDISPPQALLASEPKKGKMDLLKITMKELISLALSVDASKGIVPQVMLKMLIYCLKAEELSLCCIFIS